MPNETNLHRGARKLQKLTGMTYQQAHQLLSDLLPQRPNLDDPAVVADLVAKRQAEAAPAAPLSELAERFARIVASSPARVVSVAYDHDDWEVTFDVSSRELTFVERRSGGDAWTAAAFTSGPDEFRQFDNPDDAGIDEDLWFRLDEVRGEVAQLCFDYGYIPMTAAIREYFASVASPTAPPVDTDAVSPAQLAAQFAERFAAYELRQMTVAHRQGDTDEDFDPAVDSQTVVWLLDSLAQHPDEFLNETVGSNLDVDETRRLCVEGIKANAETSTDRIWAARTDEAGDLQFLVALAREVAVLRTADRGWEIHCLADADTVNVAYVSPEVSERDMEAWLAEIDVPCFQFDSVPLSLGTEVCRRSGRHLTRCDDDGYCLECGDQAGGVYFDTDAVIACGVCNRIIGEDDTQQGALPGICVDCE